MGGDYYERPVIEIKPNPHHIKKEKEVEHKAQFSEDSHLVFSGNNSLHKSNDPKHYFTDPLVCKNINPIVFALDVTGSMGDWPKIIYDKLPMFYGQIMMNSYLKDPSISFCAIGDVSFDRAPLQITSFGQGQQLDQLLAKIYLERGGGNNTIESYEIAAFFYLKHCELPKAERAYFFVTGDEGFYDSVTGGNLIKIFGVHADSYNHHMKKIPSIEVWAELMKKFNVFHLHKTFKKQNEDTNILDHWVKALGRDRVLEIQTPKACIDVILGAIALTSGSRDLEGYVEDMKKRGQTEDRIEEVKNALKYVKFQDIGKKTVQIEKQKEEEKKEEDP